ncbi:MAG: NAD(P)-binding domain-containing protein [Butyricicoccus sp.]
MREKETLPTLGFLGTGAITTAMVTGFCERAADVPYPIVISPKYEENAAMLQAAYPDRVTVARDLQEVVDKSDWVIVAVLPQVGEEVLSSLTFRPEHKVINVMFDKTVEQLRQWMNVEVETMLHMIPGTYLSFYPGPIVQCPPTPEAAEIFGHIGKIINVDSRYQAAVFGSITGCFAPIFAVMDHLIDWAVSEGVPADAATTFVTNMFAAVTQESCSKDRSGVHTMATVSTPGGINMQALELITNAGGFQAWVDAMRPVMARTAEGIPIQ